MSTWKCGNPSGKWNKDSPGGNHNWINIQPEGYYEGWIEIWKVLNDILPNDKITSEQERTIRNSIDKVGLEEKQIAKFVIAEYDTETIKKSIMTIKEKKGLKILPINVLIQTLVILNRVKTCSKAQLRRYANVDPIALKKEDIVEGKTYYYTKKGDGNKSNSESTYVKVIKIHYDDSQELYYTIEFNNGKQRQVPLDKLSSV